MQKRHVVLSAFFAVASVVASASLVPSTAQAAGYGAAGCGLGSIVFGDKPGFWQVLAATTNGTFASQTFGITTGTSNCGDSAAGQVATRSFIDGNREVLAKDIARGNGETLVGLSEVAGCANPADVASVLQTNYSSIFPTADASNDAVAGQIMGILQAPSLSCNAIS